MASTVNVAAAVLRNAEAQILIQQRPPGKNMAGYWEFPGGKVHPGESAWQALIRELDEELGITARAGKPLISLHHSYPEYRVRLQIWEVDDWHGSVEPREQQVLQWLVRESLPAVRLLPADVPVVTALRLPSAHLITPDLSGNISEFLHRLTAAVTAHDLKLVTLRQTSCDDLTYRQLALAAVTELFGLNCEVLLHGDPQTRLAWVDELGAAGFHLRSTDRWSGNRVPRGHWLAMSCHDRAELRRAAEAGVDFAVLGSVAQTASHPQAEPLGWRQFQQLVAAVNFPVYAIGGMGLDDIDLSRAGGGQGIAAIRALWNPVAAPS